MSGFFFIKWSLIIRFGLSEIIWPLQFFMVSVFDSVVFETTQRCCSKWYFIQLFRRKNNCESTKVNWLFHQSQYCNGMFELNDPNFVQMFYIQKFVQFFPFFFFFPNARLSYWRNELTYNFLQKKIQIIRL